MSVTLSAAKNPRLRGLHRLGIRRFLAELGIAAQAVLIAAGITAVAGCTKRETAVSSDTAASQVLRLSQRNEPSDLDPAHSALPDDFFVLRALSEGLLVPGLDGRAPQPGAAERWEVSDNGLVYTFHLRANAKWSNGEPVTAADFISSYKRLLNPATAAPKAHLFFAVKNARAFTAGSVAAFSEVGFRAADSATLVVTLERPTPRFPLYVASGPWIPVNPRVVERNGRNWTRPENFVGNGPFILAEWRPHQRIVVKKSSTYYDASHVNLSEIQFIAFDDVEAEDRAYRAGQIDVTMDVPKTKIEVYARERPSELHRTPLAETRYLTFNLRRPPLDNPEVRRGLTEAIDRERLVKLVLRGGQIPAERFVPPVTFYHPPVSREMALATFEGQVFSNPKFSLEGAQAAFQRSGFNDGKRFPLLELSAWSRTPALEAIQAMWKETLGIEVKITVRDAKVHLAALQGGDYDIGFATVIPDVATEEEFLANFQTGAPGNYSHWTNQGYDARFAEATQIASHLSVLDVAEQILLRDLPAAPLYFNTKNWLMSPRVHGWHEDAIWQRDYRDIYLDEK